MDRAEIRQHLREVVLEYDPGSEQYQALTQAIVALWDSEDAVAEDPLEQLKREHRLSINAEQQRLIVSILNQPFEEKIDNMLNRLDALEGLTQSQQGLIDHVWQEHERGQSKPAPPTREEQLIVDAHQILQELRHIKFAPHYGDHMTTLCNGIIAYLEEQRDRPAYVKVDGTNGFYGLCAAIWEVQQKLMGFHPSSEERIEMMNQIDALQRTLNHRPEKHT